MLTHTHRHHHHHSPSHMGPPPTPSFFNLTFSLLFITLTLFRPCILAAYAESNESRASPLPSPNLDDVAGGIVQSPPLALYSTQKPSSSSFKPGVFIVVGVLTLLFSLTFLLLLYIKHCNGGNIHTGVNITSGISASRAVPPLSGRKNSGIDRSIVESLPIFRFGSLMGQKDGLDCAVCLNKFEAAEILRLLPKCKHAFHVECVDTWLDAHSTCPLCRYRVDPEDILLVGDTKVTRPNKEEECLDIERGGRSEIAESRRRHSSVGEREWERTKTASFRRSLDSATSRKKNESVGVGIDIGCFVRPRKDGMLLTQDTENREREREREKDRTSVERRLEHRIIVSPSPHTHSGLHQHHQRWSDVQPSDLLYLTSEMIISELCRVNNQRSTNDNDVVQDSWNGRGIINSRSVSEITGLSRFSSNNNNISNNGTVTEREEGLVSRWLAWISQSHSQPAVR